MIRHALFRVTRFFTERPAIAWTAYGFVLVTLSGWIFLGGLDPLPGSSVSTPLDWASWFDIYVTYPVLAILCLLPFRRNSGTISLVALVSLVPLSEILFSYYVFYRPSAQGLGVLNVPWTQLVPPDAFVPLLIVPVLAALGLSAGLFHDRVSMDPSFDRAYYLLIAAYSVLLSCTQIVVRWLSHASMMGVVSDVGITTNAGGRYLLEGVNPYGQLLPPWGGPPGLEYGPVTFASAAPFSAIPMPLGAELATFFFVFLMVIGIWKCIQVVNPQFATTGALLFLALPTTSWVLEGAMEIHAIGGAIIVWTVYAFLSKRNLTAGILCSLGLLAMIVPILLLPPMACSTRVRKERVKILLPPLVIVGGGLAGAALFFPSLFARNFSTLLFTPTSGTLSLNSYAPPLVSAILAYGLTGSMVVISSILALKGAKRVAVLPVLATVLLLVPFTSGFYFPFFFLWGSSVAIIALFARAKAAAVDGNSRTRANPPETTPRMDGVIESRVLDSLHESPHVYP